MNDLKEKFVEVSTLMAPPANERLEWGKYSSHPVHNTIRTFASLVFLSHFSSTKMIFIDTYKCYRKLHCMNYE
jgi:hypothetical protein